MPSKATEPTENSPDWTPGDSAQETTAKPPTIRDVANAAGVAISSVSRVLSNHPHVSGELRSRVEAAARELGYRPNYLAHSLRRGTTASIGFLVGTLSNPIVADLSAGASEVLASSGYATLLVSSQNDPAADVDYLHFLNQRRVNGLIISSAANGPDDLMRALLLKMRLPAVLLDRRPLQAPHISAVYSDHVAGVRAAVAHLVAQGHRRIALVGGLEHFDPAAMRLAGYRQGLEEAGLPFDPGLVRSWGMGRQAGYLAARDLMATSSVQRNQAGHALPTALIAGGNLILAGVLQALKELGIGIGRDLALVGCDDTDLTRLHTPSITVIARDLGGVGRAAAATLLATIEQGAAQTIVLPTRLEVRESSLGGPQA
jgi:LacI family transcriptional regulator